MGSQLFSPIRMGGIEFSNRIVVSPMCQYSARDGIANDWHRAHYTGLAMSGTALVILEATATTEQGRITHGCLGLWNDTQEAALKALVDHCRAVGNAKLGIQVGHAGRKASSQVPWDGGKALEPSQQPWATVAPSALPFGADWHTPNELSLGEIAALIDSFGEAASRADRAGFDLFELHAAHGYLINQFFSPISNQRTDYYGGSPENRRRFVLECFEAARAAWPKAKTLGARISGRDWMEGGTEVEDAVALARELEALGCDFLDVTSGGLSPDARVSVGPGYQLAFAAAVKAAVKIPVMAVGMIWEPKQAEAIIAGGQADLVALARAFLDDPRWPWHAAAALGQEIPYPPQYRRAAPNNWPGRKISTP